jgi:AcrR family transcriptional regulator
MERSFQTSWNERSRLSTGEFMSGKPQYDEYAVLDAAITVFWQHGYASASVGGLTEATGLSRSSLYQRFGDKDGLFNEALARYSERVVARMRSVKANSAKKRMETLLREFLPKDTAAQRPAGCLLTRSCTEQSSLTIIGKEAANAGVGRQREVLLDILQAAKTQGEVCQHANLESLSWYYLGTLQAIVNLPPAGASNGTLEDLVNIAMSTWPLPARK